MGAATSMSSPSKFQSLQGLLQIKKDNYLGAMGKDYCPFEVEELIIQKKNKLADEQVRAVERWEKTLTNYQNHNASPYCPEPPKVEPVSIKFNILY